MISTSVHLLHPDVYFAFGLLLAAAALAYLWLNGRSRGFFAMKAAAVAFAALMLAGPVLVKFRVEKRPVVAVLCDISQSMRLAKRLDSAAAFIDRQLPGLEKGHRVKLYGFGSSSRLAGSAGELLGMNPGEGTDIAKALWEVKRENGEALAGVLLVSDGNHNAGPLPDGWLAGYGAPVFAVAAGSAGKIKDIAVNSVRVGDFAFKNVPLDIVAEVSGAGFAGRSTTLRLRGGPAAGAATGGEVLAARAVTFSSDSETQDVPLRFTPSASGSYSYTVEADQLEGEVSAANNSRSFALNILRDKLRILFLSGRPGPEYAFLRNLLRNDPMVELVSFVILRNPENIMLVTDEYSSLIPFPAAELFTRDIYGFDALIFQNFGFAKLGLAPEYFANIRDWVVNRGGGMVMTGGENSFNGGGWNYTAVEELIPARESGAGGPAGGTFRAKAAAPGNFILRVADSPGDSEALWKSAPELDGCHELSPKAGAEEVLQSPWGGSAVLTVWDKGKGRAAALGTDTTWRWALGSQDLALYNNFWKNLIRYLTRTGRADEWQFSFDRPDYFAGQEFTLKVRKPFDTGTGRAWAAVTGPDGERGILPLRKAGAREWSGKGRFSKTGRFRFELYSESGGSQRREASFENAVGSSLLLEQSSLNVDERALREAAALTDGAYFDEFDFSPEKIYGKLKQTGEKTEIEKSPAGASWPWFALIAALLAAEWFLRKRKGLW